MAEEHHHIWCVHHLGERIYSAHCRCGLSCLGARGLASVDPAAYEQLVDPDGLQRAFMRVTGLK